MRNVEITDLLGREEVSPDPSLLSVDITISCFDYWSRRLMGSELCRQIAAQLPKKLFSMS